MASSRRAPSAYVMDFDGTLFTLPVDWKAVRAGLTSAVGASAEGVSIFRFVDDAVVSNPEIRGRLFSLLDSYETPAAEQATPIGGALGAIARLGGPRTGLVTMQGSAACRRVLSRYSVGERFGIILTREDSLDRAEQLTMALKAMNVPAREALFVGDKRNDVEAGKKVGVTVALVGGREKAGWGADRLIPDVGALEAPGPS